MPASPAPAQLEPLLDASAQEEWFAAGDQPPRFELPLKFAQTLRPGKARYESSLPSSAATM